MAKAKLKIKKGDEVLILTGKDKGSKGEVLKVMPEERRVIVQALPGRMHSARAKSVSICSTRALTGISPASRAKVSPPERPR